MRVFSSIKGEDIDPRRVTTSGPKFLRNFLIYAEYGRLDQTYLNELAKTESRFEDEVYHELTPRGLSLRTGWRGRLPHPTLASRMIQSPSGLSAVSNAMVLPIIILKPRETATDSGSRFCKSGVGQSRIWSADGSRSRGADHAYPKTGLRCSPEDNRGGFVSKRKIKRECTKEAEPPPAIEPVVLDFRYESAETASQLVAVEGRRDGGGNTCKRRIHMARPRRNFGQE